MTLEQRIQDIVGRAAGEIASAVRQNIAAEVTRLVGGGGAAAPARTAGGASRGGAARGPKKTAKPGPKGRRGGRRRGVADADLDRVLQFVKSHPNLRTEEIKKQAGLGPDVVAKALAKLKTGGAI